MTNIPHYSCLFSCKRTWRRSDLVIESLRKTTTATGTSLYIIILYILYSWYISSSSSAKKKKKTVKCPNSAFSGEC